MAQPTWEEVDKEDTTPEIGEVKIDRSKKGSIPNVLRGHLFGDGIGEGIIAE